MFTHKKWRPAKWVADATAHALYADLLRQAKRRGSIVSRRVNGMNQYDVHSVCKNWPQYEERLLQALRADAAVS